MVEHEEAIRKTIKSIPGIPAEEVDDLVQDTYEGILKGWGETEHGPEHQATSVAWMVAHNWRTKSNRRRDLEAEGEHDIREFTGPSELGSDPLDILVAEEAAGDFSKLHPTLRRVVEMYYVQGLDVEAIARVEYTTPAAVYKRLERARTELENN